MEDDPIRAHACRIDRQHAWEAMAGADPGGGGDIGGQMDVVARAGPQPVAKMAFRKRLAVPW